MKKSLRCLASLLLAFVLFLTPVLTACESGGAATHTLTFMVDGAVYETREGETGSELTPPDSPAKEGHTFVGWYEEASFETPYTLPATMPDADMTLYGKFRSNVRATLTLDANGGEGVAATVQDYVGEAVDLPTPQKAGHVFGGWFTDAALQTPFDGNMPEGGATLYAKWSRDENFVEFTLVFGSTVSKQYFEKDSSVRESSLNTSVKGYRLVGWKDEGGASVTFPLKATQDMRLVAEYYSTGLQTEPAKEGTGVAITGYTGTTTEVIIPATLGGKTVTEIGYEDEGGGYAAFTDNLDVSKNITSITLPSTVERIYANAFSDLPLLEKVNIPSTIKYIGEGIFERCPSLKEVDFAGNEEYPFEKGALYNSDRTTLLGFYGSATEYTVPASVKTIGAAALSYASIGTLTVPSTVETVAPTAFRNTYAVTVNYSAKGTVLADEAFAGAIKLASIDMSGSEIQTIGTSAFAGCSALHSVTLPDSCTLIKELAFENCASLEDVDLKNAVLEKGNVFSGAGIKEYELPEGTEEVADSMFVNWNKLTSVTIPDSVTRIGKSAFRGCISLTQVNFGDAPELKTIDELAFAGCAFTTFAFEKLTKLEKIGENAFDGCRSLTKVYIPDSVHELGANALSGCSALEELRLTFIGLRDRVGMKAYLEGLQTGSTGLSETGKAYLAATESEEKWISFMSTLETGSSDFLFGIIFGTSSYDNAQPYTLKTSDSGSLLTFYIPASLTSITLDMKVVPAFSFYSDMSRTVWQLGERVLFGTAVEVIGNHAFAFNSGRTTLDLTENTNLKRIETSAFYWSEGLKTVRLPESLKAIGESAFSYCSALTDVTLPAADNDDPILLGKSLFHNDARLQNVVQGSTQQTGAYIEAAKMDSYVFSNCTSLKKAYLGDHITFLCYVVESTRSNRNWWQMTCSVFSGAGIEEATLGSGFVLTGEAVVDRTTGKVETITQESALPGELFYSCASLTKVNADAKSNVNIPDVGKIHAHAFTGTGIEEFRTGEKTWYIGAGVFGGSQVKEAYLPAVVEMDPGAFRGASNLKKAVLSYRLTKLEYNLFYEATAFDTLGYYDASNYTETSGINFYGALDSGLGEEYDPNVTYNGGEAVTCTDGKVVFSENVTDASEFCIFLRTAIKDIEFPEKATVIGARFLSECHELRSIVIPKTVEVLDDQVFYQTAISSVEFELDENGVSPLREVGSYVFEQCTNLREVVFPEGVRYIGTEIFTNCSNLETVVLPSTTIVFGRGRAFSGCDKLKSLTMLSPVPVESDGGSSQYSNFFYSTSLDRGYTAEELVARGMKVYVPKQALPAYREFHAVYNMSAGSLTERRGLGAGSISQRSFGWCDYATNEDLFIGVDVGTYVHGQETISLTNQDGTEYLKGTVNGRAYNALTPLTPAAGGYTLDGTALTLGENTLTVGETTYAKVTGAYMEGAEYALAKDRADATLASKKVEPALRAAQYLSFLLLAENGEVIFTHFQPASNYTAANRVYQPDDYFGTWRVKEDGTIEIRITLGNAGFHTFTYTAGGTLQEQTLTLPTNATGTETKTETFQFELR